MAPLIKIKKKVRPALLTLFNFMAHRQLDKFYVLKI